MTHYLYMLSFKSFPISIADAKYSKTIYKMALLASILYLTLELLIIYDYLQ